ncbi:MULTISPECIES: riboflavin synthase [unclassified Saccharibacter]|uniref:riboflavin synthase n=1 Tax=unclassified Saccharibacter TaxID=2648722 RepID=UPI00132C184E|nr:MULTISPECIES: riboflavin synthase [unclassified Saccharibacter]MXV36463.1 riboflavin synthase [Saccharibacter sp. EH611]MXV57625.1 riboflavin synthase [Saccharibacter sp. EH70]MXV65068.1 riboflavin synthase [Saccharibacter sp. EH60]
MFSGIIEHVGQVCAVTVRDQAMDLQIESHFTDLTEGESIAVNGVCLTATQFNDEGRVSFHLSGETLARTALGRLKKGASVNLERAVSLNTRLSGHIVQGHVDTIAVLTSVDKAGDSYKLHMFIPQELRRYVVEKGSITLDGISLTVNHLHDGQSHEGVQGFEIGLMIIPHTWTHTDLSTLSVGDALNVEVDMMAKYVENLLRFSPEDAVRRLGGEGS